MSLTRFLKPFLDGASKSGHLSRLSSAAIVQPQGEELDKLYKYVELEMRGIDPAVLKSFSTFLTTTGKHFDLETKAWTLRKPFHERFTVLKAAHIYKKHMVQYEVRTYYSFVQYKHLTGSTADTIIEYIQRNLPEGVCLKTTEVEIQKLPEHLVPPKQNQTQEMLT